MQHRDEVDSTCAGEIVRQGPLNWTFRSVWNDHWQVPEAGRHEMNVTLIVPVPPGCSVDAAVAAWRALVERHEVLRTTIAFAPDGTPVQRVHRPDAVGPPRTIQAAPETAEAWANRLAERPIEVMRTLSAPAVLAAGDVASHLILVFHHLAVDEWSFDTIKRQPLTLLSTGDGKI